MISSHTGLEILGTVLQGSVAEARLKKTQADDETPEKTVQDRMFPIVLRDAS